MVSEQSALWSPHADQLSLPLRASANRDWGSLITEPSSELRVVEPGDDFQTVRVGGRLWYVTPTDPHTGIVYPILQHEPLPTDNPERANLHHGNHPAGDTALSATTLLGTAQRNSRLQLVRATEHNLVNPKTGKPVYHDYFFGGRLIHDEDVGFKSMVAACVGDIPPYAIDMRNGEPQVVELTGEQRALMQTIARQRPLNARRIVNLRHIYANAYAELPNPAFTQEAYVEQAVRDYMDRRAVNAGFSYRYISYRVEPVRDFFRHYVFKQQIDVMEREVDEFLTTDHLERKLFLGNLLVAKAVEAAADNAQDVFKVASARSGLPPVYEGSRSLVRDMLGRTASHRGELAVSYARQLSQQYGMVA